MKSKITSKFQVTIPKEIRRKLKINVADAIEWKIEENGVVIEPVRRPFMKYKGIFQLGAGDVQEDIIQSRKARTNRNT